MKNELSAEQMLEIWGLRSCGSSLKNPLKPSTWGGRGSDDELVIVDYVESVPGFGLAKEALVWVFRYGNDPTAFPLVRPGETCATSLIRRQWGMHLGRARQAVCGAVVREFMGLLEERIKQGPPVFPIDLPEEEAEVEAIVASVQAMGEAVRTW